MREMSPRFPVSRLAALALLLGGAAVVGGCSHSGELVVDEGVGITAVRTSCPAVGLADYTGDITLFQNPGARDAGSVDISAAMTDVRGHCDQSPNEFKKKKERIVPGELVHSTVTFKVVARRPDPAGARDVVLPYFVTVLRGGTSVTAKRIGTVTLHFADGQLRTEATAQGQAVIDKASATLARRYRDQITQKRKAGEADAAVDPLADPTVQAAVSRASFEVLVGFQLTQDQLAYNATR